jgi:catechol 2,3-dioxygenase-like lactoylglutathione lyase family enzyme
MVEDMSVTRSMRINHVSVNARHLAGSVSFYTELFVAIPLPTPDFGFPVQWLGLADAQIHLFERDGQPRSHHHFALTVEDLEPVYRRAAERRAFDETAFGHHLVELPGDVVQTYLRDPAGNLLELDTPFASRLPASLRRKIKPISELRPQSDENRRARLNLAGSRAQHVSRPTRRSAAVPRSMSRSSKVSAIRFAHQFLEPVRKLESP